MPFEYGNNPFAPPTPRAVGRGELTAGTMGAVARDILDELDGEEGMTEAEGDVEEGFVFTQQETEQIERVSRLLRRAHENAERISGRGTRAHAYLYLVKSEQRIHQDTTASYQAIIDFIEEEYGNHRDFLEQYDVFTSLLKDPQTPDDVCEKALATSFAEKIRSPYDVYVSLLCCHRGLRQEDVMTDDEIRQSAETGRQLTEDDQVRYGIGVLLSSAKIQQQRGEDPSVYLDWAQQMASETSYPRAYLDEIFDACVEWKLYDRLVYLAVHAKEESLARELLERVIALKDVPENLARTAYERLCDTAEHANPRLPGVPDPNRTTGKTSVIRPFIVSRTPPEDGEMTVPSMAMDELQMRSLFVWGEKRFGPSLFPEFEAWTREVLPLVSPQHAYRAHILVAEMCFARGEDAAKALQAAKDSVAHLAPQDRLGWIIDILRLEVEHGYPYHQTLALAETLYTQLTDEMSLCEKAHDLARILLNVDLERVESYLDKMEREVMKEEQRPYLLGYQQLLVKILGETAVKFYQRIGTTT